MHSSEIAVIATNSKDTFILETSSGGSMRLRNTSFYGKKKRLRGNRKKKLMLKIKNFLIFSFVNFEKLLSAKKSKYKEEALIYSSSIPINC